MGKTEKTGEIKKPAAAGEAPKAHGGAPQGQPNPGSSKGSAGAKVGCHADGCKSKDVKMSFCDEHFKQFKFGLITKKGEKVLDFEKKFEHYQRMLKNSKAGKVA